MLKKITSSYAERNEIDLISSLSAVKNEFYNLDTPTSKYQDTQRTFLENKLAKTPIKDIDRLTKTLNDEDQRFLDIILPIQVNFDIKDISLNKKIEYFILIKTKSSRIFNYKNILLSRISLHSPTQRRIYFQVSPDNQTYRIVADETVRSRDHSHNGHTRFLQQTLTTDVLKPVTPNNCERTNAIKHTVVEPNIKHKQNDTPTASHTVTVATKEHKTHQDLQQTLVRQIQDITCPEQFLLALKKYITNKNRPQLKQLDHNLLIDRFSKKLLKIVEESKTIKDLHLLMPAFKTLQEYVSEASIKNIYSHFENCLFKIAETSSEDTSKISNDLIDYHTRFNTPISEGFYEHFIQGHIISDTVFSLLPTNIQQTLKDKELEDILQDTSTCFDTLLTLQPQLDDHANQKVWDYFVVKNEQGQDTLNIHKDASFHTKIQIIDFLYNFSSVKLFKSDLIERFILPAISAIFQEGSTEEVTIAAKLLQNSWVKTPRIAHRKKSKKQGQRPKHMTQLAIKTPDINTALFCVFSDITNFDRLDKSSQDEIVSHLYAQPDITRLSPVLESIYLQLTKHLINTDKFHPYILPFTQFLMDNLTSQDIDNNHTTLNQLLHQCLFKILKDPTIPYDDDSLRFNEYSVQIILSIIIASPIPSNFCITDDLLDSAHLVQNKEKFHKTATNSLNYLNSQIMKAYSKFNKLDPSKRYDIHLFFKQNKSVDELLQLEKHIKLIEFSLAALNSEDTIPQQIEVFLTATSIFLDFHNLFAQTNAHEMTSLFHSCLDFSFPILLSGAIGQHESGGQKFSSLFRKIVTQSTPRFQPSLLFNPKWNTELETSDRFYLQTSDTIISACFDKLIQNKHKVQPPFAAEIDQAVKKYKRNLALKLTPFEIAAKLLNALIGKISQ